MNENDKKITNNKPSPTFVIVAPSNMMIDIISYKIKITNFHIQLMSNEEKNIE